MQTAMLREKLEDSQDHLSDTLKIFEKLQVYNITQIEQLVDPANSYSKLS